MTAIRPESASHWYTLDGEPCHEVPYASGDGMRSTTLADARKLHLLPSVTNVLSVIRKPFLEAWKADQYVEATLDVCDNPAGALLDRDERKLLALAKAENDMSEAPELGTAYHKALEEVVLMIDFDGRTPHDRPGVDYDAILAFSEWYDKHCAAAMRPEMTFASNYGFGGTVDWIGMFKSDPDTYAKFAVADWKTQRTTPNNPVRYYTDWAIQLAAYAYGICRPNASLISVVISTTEPGRIEWQEWDNSTEYWFGEFMKVFAVWRGPLGKNYDPREDLWQPES